MAAKQGNTKFKIVHDDGGYERDIYEADTIAELAEYIKAKGGAHDAP